MNPVMIPLIALKALAQNKMRTSLTMLGIIIGVGAVICVVAIGEGASASVARAITNIGANMIWVEAGGVNRAGVRTGAFGTKSLTLSDYEAIKEQIPWVTNVTPQADTRVQVVYGNRNWGTSVRGVSPEYLALRGWTVVRGGMYTDVDVDRAKPVCVLGQTIVDQLFGSQDPIGEAREQRALHGCRRAGTQGTVRDWTRSGRPVPHALHHGDEEDQRTAMARRHPGQRHVSDGR
jgi:putative ABC transport system permease protein